MSESLSIARVTVLKGHDSPDTAYVVGDYPYGRRLRCKIRYWVETKPKFGQRFVSQTTNPKVPGEVWNKPKPGNYYPMAIMYLDGIGHVQWHPIPTWITGESDARLRAMGIYESFDDAQRKEYNAMMRVSYNFNKTTWAEWAERVATLGRYIAATGEDPTLENRVWMAPDGRPIYLNDPAAYVFAARETLEL